MIELRFSDEERRFEDSDGSVDSSIESVREMENSRCKKYVFSNFMGIIYRLSSE